MSLSLVNQFNRIISSKANTNAPLLSHTLPAEPDFELPSEFRLSKTSSGYEAGLVRDRLHGTKIFSILKNRLRVYQQFSFRLK